MGRAGACRQQDAGAVAVEFALVFPVFLAIVGFMLAVGLRAIYVALAEHEVREAAREASIRTTSSPVSPYPDQVDRTALCADAAPPIGGVRYTPASDCSVVNLPATSSPGEGDVVTVTVTWRLPMLESFFGWVPGTSLDALATIRASGSVIRE
jgi:Flp pilus assembly protein TadG